MCVRERESEIEKMESKGTKPTLKKGLWKPEEDLILKKYVETHGEGNWATVSKKSGLMRSGKSCRLRWKNYLRPNIKRGTMSEDEKDLIIRLHKLLGNRWSLIAGRLPGRTDNEVKNYWNTHLDKRCRRGKRVDVDSRNEKEHPLPGSETNRQDRFPIVTGRLDEINDGPVSYPRMEDMGSFNFEIQSPLLPAYPTAFFNDDEPFMPIFDNMFLL